MNPDLIEAILAFRTTPMARVVLLALAATPGPMTVKQVGDRARMTPQYTRIGLEALEDYGLLEISADNPKTYALNREALLNWRAA